MTKLPSKSSVLFLICFCCTQLGCELTQTVSSPCCSDIISKSIIHFEEVISYQDDFKEEWDFYCDITKPSHNFKSFRYRTDTTIRLFYIDSICRFDDPPALGEPYFLPYSEQTLSEYIEHNSDSLFHPLLDKWISSSEDVFKEIECENVEFVSVDRKLSKRGEDNTSNSVGLNASFSKVYENSSEVCVEMALSFPLELKVKEIGNHLILLLFLDRESLELNNYGLGIRSGLSSICAQMEIKVENSEK